MPSTLLVKRLAGKEDIKWDSDNTDAVDNYGTGATYPVTRVNATHIPLGSEVARLYERNTVAEALRDVKADIVSLEDAVGAASHLQENTTVEVTAEMDSSDIFEAIEAVPKDLNGHTLTIEFPDGEEARYEFSGAMSSIPIGSFRNGTIALNLHDCIFDYDNVYEGVFFFEDCYGCKIMVNGGTFVLGTPVEGHETSCAITFMRAGGSVSFATFSRSGTATGTVYGVHYYGCVGVSRFCTYSGVEPFYLENDGVDTSKMAMLDENGKIRAEQLPDSLPYEPCSEDELAVTPGKAYVWSPPANGTINLENWPIGNMMQFAIVQIALGLNCSLSTTGTGGKTVVGIGDIAPGKTSDCVFYSVGSKINCVIVKAES